MQEENRGVCIHKCTLEERRGVSRGGSVYKRVGVYRPVAVIITFLCTLPSSPPIHYPHIPLDYDYVETLLWKWVWLTVLFCK